MTERVTVSELAELVGAEVVGEPARAIRRVAALGNAGPDAIGFCSNGTYLEDLRATAAGAVILRREHVADCPVTSLVVDDPYYAYAAVAARLHPTDRPPAGVHPTAVVAEGVTLGEGVSVGPHAVVEAGARLGDRAIVGAGCHVGVGVEIGEDSHLIGRVTVADHCVVGRRVILHPGVVVGADGFGFAKGPDKAGWRKVPQLGRVVLGDDVDLGANTTVDRGAIDDTVLEEGVKLDNQVHIGHNARVGARTIIAGNTVVAGSATIGCDCMIGGSTAITGHITVADGVMLMGMTGVTGSIKKSGVYASPLPAQPVREWRRNIVRITQLDNLFRRVKRLEGAQPTPGTDGGDGGD